jgi:large subunit ribosomal protein L21
MFYYLRLNFSIFEVKKQHFWFINHLNEALFRTFEKINKKLFVIKIMFSKFAVRNFLKDLLKKLSKMYAVVEIAGQQFKVEKGTKLFVHRLENEEGSEVNFDKVLLLDNEDNVTVGAPVVAKANVSAKVLRHCKGETVLVFKKKRRKGYQTLNGHRQYLTEIEIQDIKA